MTPIIACLNYADFLSITLPRTLEVFGQAVVVTSKQDSETFTVATDYDGVTVIGTDAFHKLGSPINKGAAIDLTLRACGNISNWWAVVLDADIYLPKNTMDHLVDLDEDCLYSPHRRMLIDASQIPSESEWGKLDLGPEIRNREYAGYFHAFHMGIVPKGPWYESPVWPTAQGCDSEFTWYRWPGRFERPDFEVLHLGQTRVNWNGRVSPKWSPHDE